MPAASKRRMGPPDGRAVPARLRPAKPRIGVGDRPFVPVLAKLRPPLFGHAVVARPRMMKILESQRTASVLVLAAPAGYGKTTLLAQWATSDPRPVAWLQLDENDNDTVTLMAYVMLALQQVAELNPEIDEWLLTETPPIDELILPALANDLSSADPFLLVLDDTDVLGAKSWSIVQFLVKRLPLGSQIALGGRAAPTLPLGSLAADRRLVELRSGDLAFRKGEAEDMLAEGGLQLDDQDLTSLLSRTEGWAAGLQLAMLHLKHRGDPAALAELHGSAGHIPDYLANEVLAALPLRVQRFLLRTSVLERLNTRLCNAVIGHRGSGEILAELERSNVFLSRLDERGGWHRYHPLFAEWLRTRLELASPDDVPELHRRAAAWYEAEGMPDDAFQHWMAGGDPERAADVVARYFRTWATSGRGETVLRWFSAFDENQIRAYPQLALAGAWMAAVLGNADDAAARLAAAEQGDAGAPSLEGAATFGSALLTLRALLGREGVSALRRDAEAAYRLEHDVGGTLEPLAACLAGAGRLLSERDISGAKSLLEKAAVVGRNGAPAARAASLGLLVVVAAQRGQWDEAERWAGAARDVVEDHKLSNITPVASAYAMLALVESRRGEPTSARSHIQLVGQMLGGLAPFPWLAALIAIVMAWSAMNLGDFKTAAALQREASRTLERFPDAGLIEDWIAALSTRVRAESWAGPALTASELRVLQKLTTSRSLSDIAADLFVSTNTVKSHLKMIYRKLGVSSRAQATERATSLGLVEE